MMNKIEQIKKEQLMKLRNSVCLNQSDLC